MENADKLIQLYRSIGLQSSDRSEGIIPPLLLEILYGFLIWIGITCFDLRQVFILWLIYLALTR